MGFHFSLRVKIYLGKCLLEINCLILPDLVKAA